MPVELQNLQPIYIRVVHTANNFPHNNSFFLLKESVKARDNLNYG